jgi:hypothetical protein
VDCGRAVGYCGSSAVNCGCSGVYCGSSVGYCGLGGVYCGWLAVYCGSFGVYCGRVVGYCGWAVVYCGAVRAEWADSTPRDSPLHPCRKLSREGRGEMRGGRSGTSKEKREKEKGKTAEATGTVRAPRRPMRRRRFARGLPDRCAEAAERSEGKPGVVTPRDGLHETSERDRTKTAGRGALRAAAPYRRAYTPHGQDARATRARSCGRQTCARQTCGRQTCVRQTRGQRQRAVRGTAVCNTERKCSPQVPGVGTGGGRATVFINEIHPVGCPLTRSLQRTRYLSGSRPDGR